MTAPPTNIVATVNIPRLRFLCGLLFLASSGIYTISRVISGIEMGGLYRIAMFSSILTELLTLRMTMSKMDFTPEIISFVSTSPCLPHLMLAVFLWFNTSIFFFQMLSTIIVYILLVLEYAPTDELVTRNHYWKTYGKQFCDLIAPRKVSLLKISAHFEILNLVVVLGSIFRLQGNLIHLLVFTQYLTSQYLTSPRMNQAVHFWDTIISRILSDPRCPPAIKFVDLKAREYLEKLAQFTRQFSAIEKAQKH